MSPFHHCPGGKLPGKGCRYQNGCCTVHQTYCQRDGIKHLKTEPCRACERRALHEESADPTTPIQSAEELAKQFEHGMNIIKIQIDEQIECLVYEMHMVLGIPVEASFEELDGELDQRKHDEEKHDEDGDDEEHDEEHEGTAAGSVVENGNN
ncbi:hypothetical protein PG996_002639 [Apiospora saccharicola]|uniref:Uncharacterized protein n=1 Tax=Apiospora saccharicola TaxID=335842 RepID=A0ABR1WK68_9PEZI